MSPVTTGDWIAFDALAGLEEKSDGYEEEEGG